MKRRYYRWIEAGAFKSGQIIYDRAYDADRLYDLTLDQGGEPVIPPRRHR